MVRYIGLLGTGTAGFLIVSPRDAGIGRRVGTEPSILSCGSQPLLLG